MRDQALESHARKRGGVPPTGRHRIRHVSRSAAASMPSCHFTLRYWVSTPFPSWPSGVML